MNNTQARQNMVDGQLRPNKVNNNKVIAAFSKIPREAFVTPALESVAYADACTDIGNNRFMLSPMAIARMVQSLDLQASDKVLSLGAGTGYSVAIIANMVTEVVAVEADKNLRATAINSLYDAKCQGATVHVGDVFKGWSKNAPYDKIMLEIPVLKIPQRVVEQLKDGGKVTALIHKQNNIFTATTFVKTGKALLAEELLDIEINQPFGLEKSDEFVF